MLRTIAYIIFLCTGIFAITLIVLFFRSQADTSNGVKQDTENPISISTTIKQKSLEKIQREYNFHSTDQKDVFGAFIFTFPVDISVGGSVRLYVFENDFSIIRRNLMLLSSFYNFQDTTDFYGKTMFLNDKTGDTQIVRFITEIDGQTVGFEVLRDEYDHLKSLILQ